MGSGDEIKDLQQFFIDTLQSISTLTKKVDEMNKRMNESNLKIEEKVVERLEQLENHFNSIKGTAELLNELIAELRLLVPVLHLSKLLDETKKVFSNATLTKPMEMSVKTAYKQEQPISKQVMQQSSTTIQKDDEYSPFATNKAEFKEQPTKEEKTPDVVYSSKVPSYIKEKKKPKSIWEGIRDEE